MMLEYTFYLSVLVKALQFYIVLCRECHIGEPGACGNRLCNELIISFFI